MCHRLAADTVRFSVGVLGVEAWIRQCGGVCKVLSFKGLTRAISRCYTPVVTGGGSGLMGRVRLGGRGGGGRRFVSTCLG